MGVRIAGTGSHLPGPPIDVDAFKAFVRRYRDGLSEREQERLVAETGILTRHLAMDLSDESRRETNTSMAVAAGRRALAAAGWDPNDVELLVVTTVVPDQLMPPTSTLVQEALGIARCAELEISANCTGPYKGLLFAANSLRLGQYRRVLLCSSQYTSFLGRPPWSNPERMAANQGALLWIVSDGAGALALEHSEADTDLHVWLEATGCGKRSGMSLAFGAAHPDFLGTFERGAQHVVQDNRYVLREGFVLAVAAFERMLTTLGTRADAIDHFIPAVSSMQVVRKLQPLFARRFGLRPEAWRMNFTRRGYLGGVGFISVLDDMAQTGSLNAGDLVCSFAEESSKWMCAGFVLRWNS
jgi:3-oxoacyl-[acyl-carrier-protein] synthase-3